MNRGFFLVPFAVAALFGALEHPRAAEPSPAAKVFSDAGCALCHGVSAATPELATPARQDSCTDCHTWIRAVAGDEARRQKAMAVFPLWERYERNVATYLNVPSLDAARARLDPSWVRAYLQDPYDLRPGLPETMPRFNLDEAQLDAIVSLFAPATAAPTPRPRRKNIEAGRALFRERGCTACHAFGAEHQGGVPWAPDLAHARERMSPDLAAAWIDDPTAVSAAATMPDMGVSPEEALLIRDYLWLAKPGGEAPADPGPEPLAAYREVHWPEVEERVFGKICVHCHMNPELNDGRRGPGNAGGFGWAETGIELQTREGVMEAAPLIPDALLRRREEAARDAVGYGEVPAHIARPERPGMPLGLPPLSDEDIALVRAWIWQGMPP